MKTTIAGETIVLMVEAPTEAYAVTAAWKMGTEVSPPAPVVMLDAGKVWLVAADTSLLAGRNGSLRVTGTDPGTGRKIITDYLVTVKA